MTNSKLSGKLKNVPTDTSLVCSSTNEGLNRVERLSDSHRVLSDNLGEENPLPVTRERQNLQEVSVYVVSIQSQPLMPTTPRKARILLKEQKAKIIKRNPFAIQLKYPTEETKQPITLGIDAGYSMVGFSAITNRKEYLAGELKLRMDVSKKLNQRRRYRRTRRSKLWYRKPRFNNRKNSKPKGWLAISIRHKLNSHIRLVELIKSLLPITRVRVEVASFDTQKMQNQDISGIEYQQGTLFGYTIRNYLLEKWHHQCAYCKKTNLPLEIEHIIPKSRGGSNLIANLTIACQSCNLKKSNKLASECAPKLRHQISVIQRQAIKSFKAATFMTMVRWQIVDRLKCQHTYGDRTKYQRTKLKLPKSHVNDAFIIAGGSSTHQRSPIYKIDQIRRNNRSLQTNRKGFKRSIRKRRYEYQPNDLVRYENNLYRVKGVFNYGNWVRLVNTVGTILNSSLKNVQLITYGKGFCFHVNFSPP